LVAVFVVTQSIGVDYSLLRDVPSLILIQLGERRRDNAMVRGAILLVVLGRGVHKEGECEGERAEWLWEAGQQKTAVK
jgi:hypothetical protein